jgi:hypothetical protein
MRQPAEAADAVERRADLGTWGVRIGLDHAEHAAMRQAVFDHGQIARLEDI